MSHDLSRVFVFASGEAAKGVSVVAAAGRAGALGVLGFAGEGTRVEEAARAVIRLTKRPFAARVARSAVLGGWVAGSPAGLAVLIGREDRSGGWGPFVSEVRGGGRVALAEVTSRESAREAIAAGAVGLIAAGDEAGGIGSSASTFILLQDLLATAPKSVGVWARGGIGPGSAAGVVAMGGAGVVLDGAVLLARESPLSPGDRERVARLDGGETAAIGPKGGPRVRVWAAPGSAAMVALREAATAGGSAWDEAVARWVGWGAGQARPVGQDGAFAKGLADRFVTVGGIVGAVNRAIDAGIASARSARPMAEGSALAVSHRTRFPIVQGPMTRVSDSPDFARAVADGGALPMIALAMLKGPDARRVLDATRSRLAGQPWGVGLLGFVDPALRREQVEAVIAASPPFALIAGGRPDQAVELERAGIATYLHAPSPGLLRQYLKDGARRFIFEGRECGGHVGPRSSPVLWAQAIDAIGEAIDGGLPPGEVHALFAGGLHDARSSAFLAAMVGPLASRGVKVGALVGTAYLFTEEAVATGAIVPRFQAEAIRCRETVLLETGPGHEVRVGPSPYVDQFEEARRSLIAEGKSADAIREGLEGLNAGRLRVASKGLDRADGGSHLRAVDEPEQHSRGLYMLGQAATLRDRPTTIEALHRDLAEAGQALVEAGETTTAERPTPSRPSDIAIVGLSAILPGAVDARTFWENTLAGLDAIGEIPPDRWDWRPYYDADPKAPDKVVSKWGGFVPDVPFDPLRYGMPPSSLGSIEPVQLLTLEAVRAAIDDAGYTDRPFPRERTSVVLGIGGGSAQLAMGYAFRAYLPMLDAVRPGAGREALAACEGLLPEWTEDAFPGFLLNVAAGRVANRFDLGGANFAVDAACGSSLAAANIAVRELETGEADMVILGGADTVQNPLTYLAFSKTQAFSPRGRCRPFDASADGIVISEGVAAIVLKRLADAERDGDRIYAVIKGMGSSSDGRARGLTAPSPEGQTLALRRAYAKAGVDPKTVGYVEAHGTGTAVGDVVEARALGEVLAEAGARPGSVAIGSVKSSIGHTKCAAGMAGLINAALALHHKVLPPTIGVEAPNPRAGFEGGPLVVNATARPWLHPETDRPRRAGVSAFGFGGTNFHAVLEEYDGNLAPPDAPRRDWPAELFAWSAADRSALLAQVDGLASSFEGGTSPALRDLSAAVLAGFEARDEGPVLAIVGASVADLRGKLDLAREAIRAGEADLSDPSGVHFAESPAFRGAPIAFLFPGQGSQAPGMLGDLAMAFPSVREAIEATDAALIARGRRPVGPLFYPPMGYTEADRAALRSPEVAQPAIGAACVGMAGVLGELEIRPSLVGGHSYGEFVALQQAGCLSVADIAEVSEARGRFLLEAAGDEPGTMAALTIGPERVKDVLNGWTDVRAVNFNGPGQTVVAGSRDAVARAIASARGLGLGAKELPVACAFHSPTVSGATGPLSRLLADRLSGGPALPVYSNLDASPHPSDPAAIAERMGRHLASPVKFAAMVERMHADGARVFVEAGPGGVLGPLVGAILGDRPHLSVSPDGGGRSGLVALLHALARLVAAGVSARLTRLNEGRSRSVDLDSLFETVPLPATTWLVNGSRARPVDAPEPRRLGQRFEASAPPEPTCQSPGDTSPVASSAWSAPPSWGRVRVGGEPGTVSGHASSLPDRPPTLTLPHTGGGDQDGQAIGDIIAGDAPPPRPSGGPQPGGDRVMIAFQETMRQFLDLQRDTMRSYLAGRGGTPSAPDRPRPTPADRVGELSGRRVTLVPSPEPAPSPSPATRVEPRATPLPSSIPAAQPAPDDREAIRARLVAIVRDRTGYPAETLRPDLDLEADLGIDSIKRVEILGSLRDAYPILAKGLDPSAMDDLARARTLGAIVDRFTATLTPPEPESPSSVRRLVLEAVPAEIEGGPAGLAPGGVVLVTDDGRGVARALASEIEAAGHPAVVVDPAGCDFSSESAVESLVRGARDRGPIAGIVHAAPLRLGPEPGLDPSAWSGRIGSEVRALFGLARAAGRDLERSATRGGATLIAATGMGGAFGSVGGLPTGASPSLGAVVGLAKTLAREWPTVRIRAVDLDPGEPAESLADRLLAEVFADDPRSEVGLRDGARVALATRESRLPSGEGLRLEPGSPVVLTGGARGITAAIAGELARRWRPTLLVVGTSPAPEAVEEGETAEVDDPARLREILLDRARSRGESPTAAVLDASYRALARSREIRRNLLGLRSLGATVEYGRADVRDPAALARLLDGWRDRFGPPVGLVHGAGVIHDKLLRDKSPESFDRVFGTKVDGALNLLRPVDLDALRFAAFFSSIAGRFGNRGQSDYAAANETLNKLALWLDRRIQGRVVSAMWGPWSGAGMVSDLEAHLGRQGLALIPPGVGAARFADELASGRKGDVEVILSGALGSLELPPGPRPGRVATGARS